MPPLTLRELWEMFPPWARASILFAALVIGFMTGIAALTNFSFYHAGKEAHIPIHPQTRIPGKRIP